MAHEIDETTGAAAFASVRESPWHGLGTILPDYLDARGMLREARLDWEVRFGTVFDEDMRLIKDYRRTYRSDTKATLGIVGNRYHIVQNELVMQRVEEFANASNTYGIKFGIETAGSLYGGRKIFITSTFDEAIYVGGEESEKIEKYLVITTAHNGSGATSVFLSPIRVVCANTLNLALEKTTRSFSIRHTQSAERKLGDIEAELKLIRRYYGNFEKKANDLLNTAFSEFEFRSLLEKLMPIDEDAKRAKTLMENARESLLDCYRADDLANVRHTAWGAINAVADYADHQAPMRGDNKTSRAYERTYVASDLKDKALELILAK